MTRRIFALGFLLVIAVLYIGSANRLSLTDPDEVFYSETAKEMMQRAGDPAQFGSRDPEIFASTLRCP